MPNRYCLWTYPTVWCGIGSEGYGENRLIIPPRVLNIASKKKKQSMIMQVILVAYYCFICFHSLPIRNSEFFIERKGTQQFCIVKYFFIFQVNHIFYLIYWESSHILIYTCTSVLCSLWLWNPATLRSY